MISAAAPWRGRTVKTHLRFAVSREPAALIGRLSAFIDHRLSARAGRR
jgi:hypothetical protein